MGCTDTIPLQIVTYADGRICAPHGRIGADRDASLGSFARVASNLRAILAELRTPAPDAEIVVTDAWDTFVGAFAVPDPLYQALNAAIAGVASAERVRFADPFAFFRGLGLWTSQRLSEIRGGGNEGDRERREG